MLSAFISGGVSTPPILKEDTPSKKPPSIPAVLQTAQGVCVFTGDKERDITTQSAEYDSVGVYKDSEGKVKVLQNKQGQWKPLYTETEARKIWDKGSDSKTSGIQLYFCCKCCEEYQYIEYLDKDEKCKYCADMQQCDGCGDWCHEDNLKHIGDNWYCEWCVEEGLEEEDVESDKKGRWVPLTAELVTDKNRGLKVRTKATVNTFAYPESKHYRGLEMVLNASQCYKAPDGTQTRVYALYNGNPSIVFVVNELEIYLEA